MADFSERFRSDAAARRALERAHQAPPPKRPTDEAREYLREQYGRLQRDGQAVARLALRAEVPFDTSLYFRTFIPGRKRLFGRERRRAQDTLIAGAWNVSTNLIEHPEVTDNSEDGGGRFISAASIEVNGIVLLQSGCMHRFQGRDRFGNKLLYVKGRNGIETLMDAAPPIPTMDEFIPEGPAPSIHH